MSVETYREWWRPGAAARAVPASESAPAQRSQSQDSALPFWGLMAFTFVLLLAPQQIYPVLAPLRIAMLTAALAVFSHVYTRWARGLPLIQMNSGTWAVVLLVGWAVATVPLSWWPGGSVEFLLGDYFKTLIVFLLLANVVNDLSRLQRISWGLALMAVPLAWTGIRNFSSGVYGDSGRAMGYEAALTGNPNDLALMLNLILPFAVALFLCTRRLFPRLLLGAIIVLVVSAIITTFSRAGFLTLGVTFLTYLWILRKRPERIWAPLMLVVALAALPFVPSSYYDRVGTITDIEADQTGSAQERVRDMEAATGFVLRHPIVGAGVGNNILAMNQARGEEWLEIHNVYLEYAVELGVPGLVLFLLLYRACLRSARLAVQRCAGSPGLDKLFYLAEAVRVSLFAFAVSAFFYPVAYNFYFYYIAGLAIALETVCAVEEKRITGAASGRPA